MDRNRQGVAQCFSAQSAELSPNFVDGLMDQAALA